MQIFGKLTDANPEDSLALVCKMKMIENRFVSKQNQSQREFKCERKQIIFFQKQMSQFETKRKITS